MRIADCGLRIEALLARSACYHALSVLLRHPDADTVKWLMTHEYRCLPECMGFLQVDGSSYLRESVQRLVAVLDSASIDKFREAKCMWTQEYERIFGHSVQSPAPPYELEYGEEHSHRQPQELGDIAAFYQAFGLRVASLSHERVDHIVTECEFLQYLLYKQACALDEEAEEHANVCEAAARRFLADHLGRWGPAFALRLSQVAGEGTLGRIAEVALEWVLQECVRMQVSAGARDLPLRLPKERDEVGCAACALPLNFTSRNLSSHALTPCRAAAPLGPGAETSPSAMREGVGSPG